MPRDLESEIEAIRAAKQEEWNKKRRQLWGAAIARQYTRNNERAARELRKQEEEE